MLSLSKNFVNFPDIFCIFNEVKRCIFVFFANFSTKLNIFKNYRELYEFDGKLFHAKVRKSNLSYACFCFSDGKKKMSY